MTSHSSLSLFLLVMFLTSALHVRSPITSIMSSVKLCFNDLFAQGFVLVLIKMTTPLCCIPSSPAYKYGSLLCSVTDHHIPFHLVSHINSIFLHSLGHLCYSFFSSAIVITFQQPMVVHFLRGTMGLLAFELLIGLGPRASLQPQQHHDNNYYCWYVDLIILK